MNYSARLSAAWVVWARIHISIQSTKMATFLHLRSIVVVTCNVIVRADSTKKSLPLFSDVVQNMKRQFPTRSSSSMFREIDSFSGNAYRDHQRKDFLPQKQHSTAVVERVEWILNMRTENKDFRIFRNSFQQNKTRGIRCKKIWGDFVELVNIFLPREAVLDANTVQCSFDRSESLCPWHSLFIL